MAFNSCKYLQGGPGALGELAFAPQWAQLQLPFNYP